MSSQDSTRRHRTPWRLVALGALLVGAGILLERSFDVTGSVAPNVAAKDGADDDQRLAVLEREVHRLQAAGARRSSQLAAPAVAPRNEPAGADAPAEESTPKEEAESERPKVTSRGEYLDGLSDKMDTEPLDPGWRVETEREISTLLPEQFGPGVTVDQVACASSVCRVRLTHADSPRLDADKTLQFVMNRGSLASMEMQIDTREDGTTTFYFLRQQPGAPAAGDPAAAAATR